MGIEAKEAEEQKGDKTLGHCFVEKGMV